MDCYKLHAAERDRESHADSALDSRSLTRSRTRRAAEGRLALPPPGGAPENENAPPGDAPPNVSALLPSALGALVGKDASSSVT